MCGYIHVKYKQNYRKGAIPPKVPKFTNALILIITYVLIVIHCLMV